MTEFPRAWKLFFCRGGLRDGIFWQCTQLDGFFLRAMIAACALKLTINVSPRIHKLPLQPGIGSGINGIIIPLVALTALPGRAGRIPAMELDFAFFSKKSCQAFFTIFFDMR